MPEDPITEDVFSSPLGTVAASSPLAFGQTGSYRLLENGDSRLLENGDFRLIE